MAHHHHGEQVPRWAIVCAGVIITLVFIASLVARRADLGTVRMAEARVVAAVEMRFVDQENGAIWVYTDGEKVGEVAPETDGFVRGVLRSMARHRKLEDMGAEQPLRLTRWADGRLSLTDPSTGRVVELDAFGPTNSASFRRLMDAGTNGKESLGDLEGAVTTNGS